MTQSEYEMSGHKCPECGHMLMAPLPAGTPGDDSYYCEGCGSSWSLDLKSRTL